MRCPYCKYGRIRSSVDPHCPECGSSLWEMIGQWPENGQQEEPNDRNQNQGENRQSGQAG